MAHGQLEVNLSQEAAAEYAKLTKADRYRILRKLTEDGTAMLGNRVLVQRTVIEEHGRTP